MACETDLLKLENQICFPLYAASRMVTQQYKPLLDKLELTYPQYLVFLVLWENDDIPVKELSEKLLLETNTLTPLLKRLEVKGLLKRQRSKADERKVMISLTSKGKDLQKQAAEVPQQLISQLDCMNMEMADVEQLKNILTKFLNTLKHNT